MHCNKISGPCNFTTHAGAMLHLPAAQHFAQNTLRSRWHRPCPLWEVCSLTVPLNSGRSAQGRGARFAAASGGPALCAVSTARAAASTNRATAPAATHPLKYADGSRPVTPQTGCDLIWKSNAACPCFMRPHEDVHAILALGKHHEH